MKSCLILALLIVSTNVFSQTGTTKARAAVLPSSVQARDTVKPVKKEEAPCDSKEDILKKLEAEKKAKSEAGKGFSLQGKTDAGCTL